MQHAPKISIITPVLNGARFLPYLLSSLREQTMQEWQHVVVDGGSTDSTLEVLRAEYKDDPRFVLIERPGLGIYASVIEGMRAADGKVLGWQNADDRYTSWAFESIVEYQARSGADWMTGLPGCWDKNDVLRFVRPYGWYPRSLIRRGWFHVDLLGFIQQESIFFTGRAFDGLTIAELASISNANLAGDFMLWRGLARSHRLSVLPTVVSGFRRHPGNRSHADFDTYMREVRADGAAFFPRPLPCILRTLYRLVSAAILLGQVEREDRALSRNLPLD